VKWRLDGMNKQRGCYCIDFCIRKSSERIAITRINRTRIVVRNRFGIYSWNAIQVRNVLRSPDTATPDEVRRFQLHLVEGGASICNRDRIMTGVRFLFRVSLRRHDLAAEIWHIIKEPQKLPPVLSPEEVKRVLTMATSLKARAMLTLAYGCGLRAGEVMRLRACDIDSEQMIIRIVQSKGRKDRNVMLPPEILDLLRQWWKAHPDGIFMSYCRFEPDFFSSHFMMSPINAKRRRLSKLSCAGWLTHDRGFVLDCLGLGASIGGEASS
jgi:integrase